VLELSSREYRRTEGEAASVNDRPNTSMFCSCRLVLSLRLPSAMTGSPAGKEAAQKTAGGSVP
jgi:hypothetical protein